jgi:urease accessory protein
MPAAAGIITTITTTMTDPRHLVRLLAWMSPAFPTGGFAYSHGLEWAIEAEDITDAASLSVWLDDVLRFGAGWSDAILLRHAHRSTGDEAALRDLADLALALAPARERREETLNQGRAFALAAAPWVVDPPPSDAAYPVVVGAMAGSHGIAEDDVAVAYLQVVATNLISAAVRLIPLGQTDGLRVLAGLEASILALAADSRSATLDDIGGCAFRSDLASMRHETQYTRLFRS